MRRFIPALLALALVAPPTAEARTTFDPVKCQDYCAERAAEHCERIDSWECAWYILGCLAGCNLASL